MFAVDNYDVYSTLLMDLFTSYVIMFRGYSNIVICYFETDKGKSPWKSIIYLFNDASIALTIQRWIVG